MTGLSGLFNRANLVLNLGDELLVIIPNFRSNEARAREFTQKEILDAGWRVFSVEVTSTQRFQRFQTEMDQED